MKAITMEDLCGLQGPFQPVLSPDGENLAFLVRKPDRKENRYDTCLWLLKKGREKACQMTYSGKDGDFIWEDEETLLILSDRDAKDGDEKESSAFYRLKVNGGEAAPAFAVDKTVVWFRQVKKGVFCLGIREDRNAIPEGEGSEEEKKDWKDYHVIDEVPVWGNGRGFVSGVRICLYLYTEADGKLKKLSPDEMDVSSIDVKGDRILCLGKAWKDVIDITDSLLLFDLADGSCRTLIPQGKWMMYHACFLKDGIAFTASDGKKYGNGQYQDLYFMDPESGEETLLVHTDHLVGQRELATDSAFGGGELFLADQDEIYASVQYGPKMDIRKAADGEWKKEVDWDGMLLGFEKKGRRTVWIGMEPNGFQELYELSDGKAKRITGFNDAFAAEHFISPAKPMPFVNSAGICVDGWVLEPKDYDPAKKYPGILSIHGGPRCTYGTAFFHEMQQWASSGYFVFFCNPRGSEGYGEEFADLRGKYGEIDYEDLMEFTDHVLEAYPQIDAGHIGASGGSYGGFMCNWIEGHTDRFAAIASQRSVANWVADFGLSEIGVTFDQNEMGCDPWNGMEEMWKRSPLAYADHAKTPILFIHSLCDYNCTIDQGVQMFTAVKYFGVPARMCLFEGENHNLSRTGKPRHRMRRLKEMNGWFETWLKPMKGET